MCGIFTYIDPRSTTPGLFSGVRCQSHESCLNVFKPNGSQIEVIWGRVMTPWDSPDWSSTMLWDSPVAEHPEAYHFNRCSGNEPIGTSVCWMSSCFSSCFAELCEKEQVLWGYYMRDALFEYCSQGCAWNRWLEDQHVSQNARRSIRSDEWSKQRREHQHEPTTCVVVCPCPCQSL